MSSLAGTGRLIRFMLRRDRIRISVWVLAISLAIMGSVASFAETYPTAADRQARAAVLDSATASLFVGPRYGADNYTYGAMTANEMLPFAAVAVGLMSVFLIVRHNRAEEEGGRADLVRANVVGRHAATTAALVVVGGANLAIFALLTLGLPASLEGLSTAGSLAFAAALAGVGFVFAGVALLVAQLTVNARAAVGLSSIVLGAAYLGRAFADMGDGTWSWLSPFGWATEMKAYVDERWWPLFVSAVFAGVLVAVAVAISARRDVGGGVIAERPGPATAPPRLGTALGLAWRLQRVGLVSWSIPLFLLGLVYGGIAQEAGQFYEDVDLSEYLSRVGAAEPADQYLALTMFISALIAAGFSIQSVLRLRAEESSLRAEPLLATPLSRSRWVGGYLAVALGGSFVLLLMIGLGMGITRAIGADDSGELPRLVGSAVAYTPGLWVFAGLAAALFGLFPQAVAGAWVVFGVFAFMGFIGPVLQLPDWIYQISPIEHVPRLPVADMSLVPELALTVVAAALLATGLSAFRNRDLLPTS